MKSLFLMFVLALFSFQIGAAQVQTNEKLSSRPAAEVFFQNPSFSKALLSPNGKKLAVLIGSQEKRLVLAVYDIETAEAKVVASFKDLDINDFQWINDNRLVFDTDDKQRAIGETYEGPGLFAVNADGSNFKQLVSRIGYTERASGERGDRDLLPWYVTLLRSNGRQNSDFVYVEKPIFSSTNFNEVLHVSLLRLNTVTGFSERVDAPFGVRQWYLDNDGEPRVSISREKNLSIVNYRDPKSKEWLKLVSFDTYAGSLDGFTPHGFGPDGKFYVVSNLGKDKDSLYRFDLESKSIIEKPVFSLEKYDFTGELITSRTQLLGVRYQSDADETYWFDKRMESIQKSVDAKLPHTLNRLSFGQNNLNENFLVESYSDIQPSVYFLYDSKTGNLNKVGEKYQNVLPKQMGRQEMIRYFARDGLEIPAYLTIPHGDKSRNLPLIVLVHGGPFVRGKTWGWDPETQFLASRGYAVLEPEFRGSTGFGYRHFHAGWKQWGLAMQDDIADGVKWAIQQGIANPKRVCIAGASYGGYATLMGLVKHADLYQCGVEWVGVSDINMMFEGYRGRDSDLPSLWRHYGMPLLIGDPIADAEQLKITSPLKQADRITKPLLMAYGREDRRVPLFHGTTMRDALKARNRDVEWIVYNDEGHGWRTVKNRVDFWLRVEKFLNRVLEE